MHNHKFLRFFTRFSSQLTVFLPSLFWLLLIYGFDEALPAGLTIICALLHELGHEAYFLLGKGEKLRIRTTLSGFRIKKRHSDSYLTDAFLYAAGPLANLAAILLFLPIRLFPDEYKELFINLNLITALSNLLPIKSYDGYGIMLSLLRFLNKEDNYLAILDMISFACTIFLAFLSLYIVGKVGNCYWMAGLFIISLVGEVSERLKQVFSSFKEY